MTMNDTIPHVMRDITTGEATTIQLKPREGMTVADVEAFLADRKAAGLLIEPASCEVINYYVEPLDIYGVLDVPDEWSCPGKELLVRNPDSAGPDRYWVWLGDLPEETCKAVLMRLEERPRRDGSSA
jgi:hypothetical protein